jgi:FtsP/CotA-like multicopper oxidase with cupredoxin domain
MSTPDSFDGAVLPKLSRRQSIQVAGIAAGVTASRLLIAPAEAGDPPPGPYTTPFVESLPVYQAKVPAGLTPNSLSPPPTGLADTAGGECGRSAHQGFLVWPAQRFYTLNVKEGWHSFHRELPTQKIWGYDGIFPGPTFVERYGVASIVRIYNDLAANTPGFGSPEISTHLHNLHCASESDGFSNDYYSATKYGSNLTAPGRYKDHHYPHCYAGYDNPLYRPTNGDPREALGTLWYHDHRADFTAPNVYRGLAGFYLLFDELDSGNENDTNPGALRLPSGVGRYDIPLMFTDCRFNSSGYLAYDQFSNDIFLGNKFCVNGKVQPKFDVAGRKYRLRLLNGGLSRFYEFYLTDGKGVNIPFDYIANDGNLLEKPLRSTLKVNLAPAERGDIVVDFASFAGTSLYLVNRLIQTDGRGPEDSDTNTRRAGLLTKAGTRIMRFDVGAAMADPSRVPDTLRALPPITLSEVKVRRRFEFDRENEVWTINGKIFDASKPIFSPKRGTAEIWTLEGKGSWHHPVHIHMEEGRILTRNGKPPPPHEAGRKDIFVLAPDEVVRVFIQFRDFEGPYMMHCHNLPHEDHAMMLRFDVVS